MVRNEKVWERGWSQGEAQGASEVQDGLYSSVGL